MLNHCYASSSHLLGTIDYHSNDTITIIIIIINYSKSLNTCRGKEGGSGREYNLVRLISIVSSSGTFVNKEQTSIINYKHLS